MEEKLVWNVKDLSQALGRSTGSIRADLHRQNWARTPPPTRLAGTLVWRPKDVFAWLEGRAIESGAVFDKNPKIAEQPLVRRRRGRPSKSDQLLRNKQG